MAGDDPHKGDERDSEGAALHRANAQQVGTNRRARIRSSGDSSLTGQVVHKVCSQCGEDLNHRPRFKDSTGRYWCPRCNEAENLKKIDVECADCHIVMPHADMTELYGRMLCPVCLEARKTGPKKGIEMRQTFDADRYAAVGKASNPAAVAPDASLAQGRRSMIIGVAVATVLLVAILIVLWNLVS